MRSSHFTQKRHMTTQKEMLATCRDQFALYAQNHRAKVGRWQQDIAALDPSNEEQAKEIESLHEKIADTIRKAETNEKMVLDIQAVIDQDVTDTLADTAKFGEIAYADGISPKNQQTQLGVHFEEVGEMLAELGSNDPVMMFHITHAKDSVETLGTMLKKAEPCIFIKDRLGFLDACCDQLVTVTVGAVLFGMDPVKGLAEVNRSNYSKLVDGVMQKDPISRKWLKGPNYAKPDLTPFV